MDPAAASKGERGLHAQLQRAAIVDSSNDAIIGENLEGLVTSWNRAAERLYGYTAQEVLGKPSAVLLPPDRIDEVPALRAKIKRGERVEHYETVRRRKDGRHFHISLTLSPIKDATGLVVGVSAIAHDITKRQRTQELLTISEARFRRLFETAQDGILILNAETGSITEANPFLVALTGYAQDELVGKKLWEIGPFKDTERSKTAFQELQTRAYVRYEDLPLEAKDGRRLDVEFVSNVYQVGDAYVIQCNIRDITERRRAERALQKVNNTLAEHAEQIERTNADLDRATQGLQNANERLERLALLDPLTGLLNRRGLQQALSQECQRARREGSTFCALLADLDDFKRINDRLGLTVGDMALVQVARQLKVSTRATDHVARIGGDEFLTLLPGTRLAEGMRIAEKLRLAIAGTSIMHTPASSVTVTASLGLVQVSDATTSIEEILSQTQMALQRSKQVGKNQVSSDGHLGAAQSAADPDAHLALLSALRQGGQFHTVRQPIFSLDEMSLVGYELLSRLAVETFEMPEDFFRISLQANLLTLVDHHCLRTCLAASRSLPSEVLRHLNLFPSTIMNIPVQQLLEELQDHGRADTYCIEISEQQVLGEPPDLAEGLRTLQQAGVLIAIDDVGYGRSSLESLVLLQPQIVKIDKSCVSGISQDALRTRSFRRLLRVVEGLGAEAVAEGIETADDLGMLKTLGVKYGQGFFLGRPG